MQVMLAVVWGRMAGQPGWEQKGLLGSRYSWSEKT